jgi:hypothetical protein
VVVCRIAPRARRSGFRGKPKRWAPTTARGRVSLGLGLVLGGFIVEVSKVRVVFRGMKPIALLAALRCLDDDDDDDDDVSEQWRIPFSSISGCC